jgi:hypothetical protein
MTKWTLAIAVLALGAVACGDDKDDDNKSDAGDNNGGTNTGNNNGVMIPDGGECTLEFVKEEVEEVGEQWTMDPPWTQQQAQTCIAGCPAGTNACIAMCANGEEFLSCYTGEILYCGADVEDAPCLDEYQTFGCCLIASCNDAANQAEFDKCLEEKCLTEVNELFACSDKECGDAALQKCVSPGGPTGDGGTRIIQPQATKSFIRALGKASYSGLAAKKVPQH